MSPELTGFTKKEGKVKIMSTTNQDNLGFIQYNVTLLFDKLSPAAFQLYCLLCTYTRVTLGEPAEILYSQLLNDLGKKDRAKLRALINQLEELNLISVEQNPGKKSAYTILPLGLKDRLDEYDFFVDIHRDIITSLSPASLKLYMFLFKYSHCCKEEDEVWPNQETIAKGLDCSTRTIKKSLAELVERKLVLVTKKKLHADTEYANNVYKLSRKISRQPKRAKRGEGLFTYRRQINGVVFTIKTDIPLEGKTNREMEAELEAKGQILNTGLYSMVNTETGEVIHPRGEEVTV